MSNSNTPIAEQIRVVLFGLRNAGKSSLMNRLFGKEVAIVADFAGTTTDPVTRSIEILPIGPITVIDTAGIDDTGEIGSLRIQKTKEALSICDIPVLVTPANLPFTDLENNTWNELKKKKSTAFIAVTFGDQIFDSEKKTWLEDKPYVLLDNINNQGISDFKKLLIKQAELAQPEITPVEGLVTENDLVILVTPIDLAAPKGRLIMPQVETIRDLLDRDCCVMIVKERELSRFYNALTIKPRLVITDSQAFSRVAADIPENQALTSFSILFARKKGDLSQFVRGVKAIKSVPSGSKVLILESCAHHKQADDIGTVKIPRLFRQLVQSHVEFISSREMPSDAELKDVKLVIQCAGCMVNRNLILNRLEKLKSKKIPVVNYGLFLAWANGLLPRALKPFQEEYAVYNEA